jgi:cell wall-associated NlpC family hydrolase
METVRVLFTRRRHPGSLAIRTFTWSAWSHVDLLDVSSGQPLLIGAVAPKGVVIEPLSYRLQHASRAALVEFKVGRTAAVLEAARSQIGKPYDWTGVAGLVTRSRDWQGEEDWFCSELVAWAIAQGGLPLFREPMVGRITPQHLWMLDNPYTRPSKPLELLDHI